MSNRKSRKRKNKPIPFLSPPEKRSLFWLNTLGSFLLVLVFGMFLVTQWVNSFDTLRHPVLFFVGFAIPGVLAFFKIKTLLENTFPVLVKPGRKQQDWIYACLLIACFALPPLCLSILDQVHSWGSPDCFSAIITRKEEHRRARGTNYYLDLKWPSGKESITRAKPEWDTFREGQVVQVCLLRSALGFERLEFQP